MVALSAVVLVVTAGDGEVGTAVGSFRPSLPRAVHALVVAAEVGIAHGKSGIDGVLLGGSVQGGYALVVGHHAPLGRLAGLSHEDCLVVVANADVLRSVADGIDTLSHRSQRPAIGSTVDEEVGAQEVSVATVAHLRVEGVLAIGSSHDEVEASLVHNGASAPAMTSGEELAGSYVLEIIGSVGQGLVLGVAHVELGSVGHGLVSLVDEHGHHGHLVAVDGVEKHLLRGHLQRVGVGNHLSVGHLARSRSLVAAVDHRRGQANVVKHGVVARTGVGQEGQVLGQSALAVVVVLLLPRGSLASEAVGNEHVLNLEIAAVGDALDGGRGLNLGEVGVPLALHVQSHHGRKRQLLLAEVDDVIGCAIIGVYNAVEAVHLAAGSTTEGNGIVRRGQVHGIVAVIAVIANADELVAVLLAHLLHAHEATRTPATARAGEFLDHEAVVHNLRQRGDAHTGRSIGTGLVGHTVDLRNLDGAGRVARLCIANEADGSIRHAAIAERGVQHDVLLLAGGSAIGNGVVDVGQLGRAQVGD